MHASFLRFAFAPFLTPFLTLFLLQCLAGASAVAAPAGSMPADPVPAALHAGGVVLLMRHASAPGTGDPPGFRLDDCATQRNLSDDGRAEARAVGARMKALGLVPGEVLTSQWCRCRDTAALAFGGAREWPALNSFLRTPENKEAQVREVLARIARVRRGDKPLVLVTHQVIVTAVTGVYPQSGEVVVVAPQRGGGVRVVGSLRPPPG